MPKILINGAISVLRKSVQKKGNFDIRDVNPEEVSLLLPLPLSSLEGTT